MTTPSRRVHGASTGSQIIKLTNTLYNKKLYVQEFYPNTNSVSIAHTLSHSNHCPPCIISLSPFSLSPTSLSLLLHLIVTLFPTTIDPLTSSPAMGEGYGASTCMRKTFSGHENESNTPMLHLPFWRRLLVPLLLWGVRRQASCNASDVPCLDPMHCNGGIDILLVQYQSCPTYTLHPPYSRF